MFVDWPGYFNPPEHIASILSTILQLNQHSTEGEWIDCLDEQGDYDGFISNDLVDEPQRFPSKRWTFLHHAAYHQAPKSLIIEMKERKFVMSLKDAEGKIPFDHLNADTPADHKELLKPIYKINNIDLIKLNKIEQHFHQVILSRVEDLVKKHNLILPMISVLLEAVTETAEFWFAVPGMYGGFTMNMDFNESKTDFLALVTSSWCRVAGGSGQAHRCTEDGWTMIDEGFV